MNRIVLGAFAALLLVGAGLFWWQGRASTEKAVPPPSIPEAPPSSDTVPYASTKGLRGPAPPKVDEATKEQKRFDRLDRDRDGRITRNEMLAPRVAAFRKLDVDHNNLLTFEEWAVRTTKKFSAADANHDGVLSREEFATTKPKPKNHPQCRCAVHPPGRRSRAARANANEGPGDASGGDEGEPGN